jgi:hypothetical protein
MLVHFLDRVRRSASGPIAVGIVLEVSLEDRTRSTIGGKGDAVAWPLIRVAWIAL